MPVLLLRVIFDQIETAPVPFLIRPLTRGLARRMKRTFIQPQLDLHLDFLEAEMAGRDWFAGPEMTAADIQMSFALEGAAARAGLDGNRPALMAFLERIHARPAYQRAVMRGGPYAL